MERKTLKFLRLLIPGLIVIFEFIPLLNYLKINFKIGEGWFSYSYLVVLALVIGSIYHIYNIRYTVTNVSHRKIDLNIVTSLIKIYNKEITQEEYNYLKDKRLLHIFYYFIDKDPSLTAKSQLVYFNGLFWTSTADLTILSALASIVYLIFGLFIFQENTLWLVGIFLSGISLLAIVFHFYSILNHYKLSNDQIEFIETHYQKELKEKIEGSLTQINN